MESLEETYLPPKKIIPPPPQETMRKGSSKKMNNTEGNLTLSTKVSTDQLICKSPPESQSNSDKSMTRSKNFDKNRAVLLMGLAQVIFGFLMMVFGIFVIIRKSSLSQVGGGIWGGILAMTTGFFGILTAAESFCPFKPTAQKVAHTVFLALSLISLAVSHLVLVISATGLGRDINSVHYDENETEDQQNYVTTSEPLHLKDHIIYNICLVVFSGLECICAAVSAYKSSRELCPCFKKSEDFYEENLNIHRSHAIVSSWLGKNNVHPAAPVYMVAGHTSTLGGRSKMSSSHLQPIYAIPSSIVQPQIIGYPLIPAPLGPVPSPIIPKQHKTKLYKIQRRQKSKSKSREPTPRRSRSLSKCGERERSVSEIDVVKTYTGLDRAMAEEFIDICESKHTSLCSDISCSNSSCQTPCSCSSNSGCQINSDTASHEYLLNKI